MEDTLEREKIFTSWLHEVTPKNITDITALAGDASFRRYFRIHTDIGNYIAMDAPPPKERCHAFVAIANTLRQLGLNAPIIYAQNLEHGFLLLSDFGDNLLLDTLNTENAESLYYKAFEDLLIIQRCESISGYTLPNYNDSLYGYYEEMSWFMTWYLQQYKQQRLTAIELAALERELHQIAKSALEQPTVFVHRDFHSRNIMVTDGQFGLLDFQDAIWGALTYDIISLIKDCYIDWPVAQVNQWALHYQRRLIDEGILKIRDEMLFLRWFDWMSLQRHLKCIGLFVRLNLRDGKSGYLQYIPRLLRYIKAECAPYPELAMLQDIINRE